MLNGHPLGIKNIVDVTSIERNLYLTMRCLEMNLDNKSLAINT